MFRDEVSRNARLQPEAAQTPFQYLSVTAPRTRKSFASGSWCSIATGSGELAADLAIGIGRNRSRDHTTLDCQMLPVTDTFRFRSLS